MFERYTDPAKRAIYFARAEAVLRGAESVTPKHLLLGLSWEEGSRAASIAALKDRMSDVCKGLGTPFRPVTANQFENERSIPLNAESKTALVHAEKEANRDWSEHIDTDHLLRGLMRFKNEASETLKSSGVNLPDIRAAAKRHRIEFPSAKTSMRWMLRQVWKIARPVVWRLALAAAIILALVLVLHFLKR